MTSEQMNLVKAIHMSFTQTYPGTPVQMFIDEAEKQLSGKENSHTIIGLWVRDYFKKAGYIK